MEMLKLSKYLIDVDLWDTKDGIHKNLIFSTRTSQLIVLDNLSWSHLQKGHYQELSQKVIERLKSNKFLVASSENELSIIISENKREAEEDTRLYTAIQPTAACPLGCGYCGQVHSPKGLSQENQSNLILYLRRKLSQKTYKSISIGWFGGDPLSGISIIDTLSPQIQSLAEEKSLSYSASLVTNGLLLSEAIARRVTHDYAVKDIEITLDGIAEFHDQRRHLKTGGGTFEKIYTNLLNLVKIAPDHVNISVRCNVDERNKDGISPLLQQLAADELQKKIHVYFAQIHSWGNDAHKLAAQKSNFAQWEIDWFLEMIELGFQLSYIPKRNKILCMAVDNSSGLIDPFGNIFNCTEVSIVPTYEKDGENIYKLGHVSEEQLSHPEKSQLLGDFYEEEEIKKYPCFTCPMLPVCGGACPKQWKEEHNPCPSAKYNIRERMLLNFINTRSNI